MKTGAIIQARMGSTRLPGKVMMTISGKTVLNHVIERVRQSQSIDEIIIATTEYEEDDIIVAEALKCGARVFRGSEEDVLSRYYYAAKENMLDTVVRITSDCPLIDPIIIGEVVDAYKKRDCDLATNAGIIVDQRTYPRGLDVEVFGFKILSEAFEKAHEKYQREHVTPYIYEVSDSIYHLKLNKDYSEFRWTLDTKEDFELINRIYTDLYNGEHNFYFSDVLNLYKYKPELLNINAHVEQKDYKY